MGYMEGLLSGFLGRKYQMEDLYRQQAQEQSQREANIYSALINSDDPDIKALAWTGLLDSAKTPQKQSGIAGWLGKMQQSPIFAQMQQLMKTPVAKTVPDAMGLPSTQYSGAITLPPSALPAGSAGLAALPGTSSVDAGAPGLTPTAPTPPQTPPGSQAPAPPASLTPQAPAPPPGLTLAGAGPQGGQNVPESLAAPPPDNAWTGLPAFNEPTPGTPLVTTPPQAAGPQPQPFRTGTGSPAIQAAPGQGGLGGTVQGWNAVAAPPPVLSTKTIYEPRHILNTPAEQELANKISQAQGNIEGERAGYRAAGFNDDEIKQLLRMSMMRRMGMMGGESIPGEVQQPDGTWESAFGVFDRMRFTYVNPVTGEPFSAPFRPRTSTGSSSINDRDALSRQWNGKPYVQQTPPVQAMIDQEVVQYRSQLAGNVAGATETGRAQAAAGAPPSSQEVRTMTRQLQDDWERIDAPHRELQEAVTKMDTGLQRIAAGDRNGGSQLILAGFQQVVGSGSSVRQAAYTRSEKGQPIAATIEGFIKQLQAGGQENMSDQSLRQMVQTAHALLQGMENFNLPERARIEADAQRLGVKPRYITGVPPLDGSDADAGGAGAGAGGAGGAGAGAGAGGAPNLNSPASGYENGPDGRLRPKGGGAPTAAPGQQAQPQPGPGPAALRQPWAPWSQMPTFQLDAQGHYVQVPRGPQYHWENGQLVSGPPAQ